MEQSLGSMAGSYALIPPYLGLLQQANPGTISFGARGRTKWRQAF